MHLESLSVISVKLISEKQHWRKRKTKASTSKGKLLAELAVTTKRFSDIFSHSIPCSNFPLLSTQISSWIITREWKIAQGEKIRLNVELITIKIMMRKKVGLTLTKHIHCVRLRCEFSVSRLKTKDFHCSVSRAVRKTISLQFLRLATLFSRSPFSSVVNFLDFLEKIIEFKVCFDEKRYFSINIF